MVIPITSLAAMVFTLLLCFVLPVVLFVLVRRKSKYATGAVIAGAVAFYIAQLLVRIPLLQIVLPNFAWFRELARHPLQYILFLSLTAALFEETARLGVFRLLLKNRLSWLTGVAYGVGHGGIEAMLIVGTTYINNLVLSVMINNGTFHAFLGNRVDAATANHIYAALTTTSPGLFFAAGLERAFVIVIQIALSVMILEGVVRKRTLPLYALAFSVHAGINFAAAYMSYLRVHYWLVALFIAACALGCYIYVQKARSRFPDTTEPRDEAEEALAEGY